MDKIDYLKIAAAVGAIVSLIITYFNKEQIKNTKLRDEYFEKVLVSFIDEYKKDNEINSITFVKERYSYSDFFIPGYIFKLLEDNREELLKKSLIVDYWDNYPNYRNNILNAINNISEIIGFLIVYGYRIFIGIVAGFLFANMGFLLLDILSYIRGIGIVSEIGMDVIRVLVSVITLIFTGFILRVMINDSTDHYIMESKKIEKLIKKREKRYDENYCRYYIK